MNTSRKPFYYLLLIFILPMLTSGLLYHYHQYFHFKTLNHGVLLKTAVNVSVLFPPINKENSWRILHITPDRCDKTCLEVNFKLAQVKKALGKDANRVNLEIVSATEPHVMEFKSALQLSQVTSKIFLIDPLNNAFMMYPDNTNPMNILKDLKRILEVSQLG